MLMWSAAKWESSTRICWTGIPVIHPSPLTLLRVFSSEQSSSSSLCRPEVWITVYCTICRLENTWVLYLRCLYLPEETWWQLHESNDIHIHGTPKQMSSAFAKTNITSNKLAKFQGQLQTSDTDFWHRILKSNFIIWNLWKQYPNTSQWLNKLPSSIETIISSGTSVRSSEDRLWITLLMVEKNWTALSLWN